MNKKMQISYGNQDIKQEVMRKVSMKKIGRSDKNTKVYCDYKIKRDKAKRMIKEAKTREWDEFNNNFQRNGEDDVKIL